MPDSPRQPVPPPSSPLHRIVVRNYDLRCHVEGVILAQADGTFTEVDPMLPRPMSWEELGRALLDEGPMTVGTSNHPSGA